MHTRKGMRQPKLISDRVPKNFVTIQIVKLVLFLLVLISTCIYLEFRLPTPNSLTEVEKRPELFYEDLASEHLFKLCKDIGVRYTGSENEKKSYEYILNTLKTYKENKTNPNVIEFDIELQDAYGSFQTSIANRDIIKSYRGIKNVIVKLSCGENCKNSILLNTHYDSTISTLGAGDSGVAAAVMLELVRVYTQGNYILNNSLYLVWNGAEETLFDGSHSFFTQHESAKSIVALINMDAIGSSGGEILFQANSDLMLNAYSKTPYPQGSTFCNDFFDSGIITSDTDYATFVTLNENLHAVDLALFKNTYYYHSFLDTPSNIPRGTLHNLGNNVLEMTKYLLSVDNIDQSASPHLSHLYFSFYKLKFFMFKWSNVIISSFFLCLLNFIVVKKLFNSLVTIFSLPSRLSLSLYLYSMLYYFLGLISSTLAALTFVFIYRFIFNIKMVHYYPESFLTFLELPLLIIGAFVVHLRFHKHVSKTINTYKRLNSENYILLENLKTSTQGYPPSPSITPNLPIPPSISEYQLCSISKTLTYSGISSSLSIISLLLALFHQGIIQFTFAFAFFTTLALAYELFRVKLFKFNRPHLNLVPQIIASLAIPFVASEITSFTSLMIPISSIAGANTEIDVIFFALFSGMLSFPIVVLLPLIHLPAVSPKKKVKSLSLFSIIFVTFSLFCCFLKFPYREFSPKRTYIIHATDLTDNTQHLLFCLSDYGYAGSLSSDFQRKFDLEGPISLKNNMNDHKYIAFFPFEKFLNMQMFDVKPASDLDLTNVKSDNEYFDIAITKSVRDPVTGLISTDMDIRHDGLANLIIRVDAELHAWTSPNFDQYISKNKRDVYTYHDVSSYGIYNTKLSFVYKYDEKSPPMITISSLINRSIPHFVETLSNKKTKATPVLDRYNPYSIAYSKIASALPDWTSPLIAFTYLKTIYLTNPSLESN